MSANLSPKHVLNARIGRRTLLKQAAWLGVTAPLTLPVLSRAVAANEQVRHVSFGASGMAWSDIKNFQRHKDVRFVAFCDIDKGKFGDAAREFPEARHYSDYRELLDKEQKNFDSCNVSTPDHMHGAIGLSAMQLGKAVYGQKPLGQNLFETRQLALAAKKYNLATQMGIQIHSHTYYRLAVELIQAGAIGRVSEVHSFCSKHWGDTEPRPERSDPVPAGFDWDLWLGVATERPFIGNGYYHPGNWRKRLDFGTGTFGDMGCHIYDPVFKALGVSAPISVKSEGPAPNAYNWALNAVVHYVFPGSAFTADQVRVTWYDGDARPPAEISEKVVSEIRKEYEKRGVKDKNPELPGQGSVFVGEKGLLLLPHIGAPKLLPAETFENYPIPKIPAIDHWLSFIDAVKGGEKPSANFSYAGPLTEAVLLGGVATRFPGQELKWDSAALRFTHADAANAFVGRSYRPGREIQKVV